MPRTLDGALLAAMNSGSFTPYFKVQLLDSDRSTVLFETTEVTGFIMDGLTAKVSFHDPAMVPDFTTFRILRGITVNGVPNTVTSSQYHPYTDRFEKRIRILDGHLFPIAYYTTPGDVTYSSIISTICTAFGFSVVHANPAAAYLAYQFYPNGRTFTLNDVKQFFTILRQKYLVFATDNDADSIYFYQAVMTGPAYPAGYATVLPGLAQIPGVGSYKQKSFLSRDENSTTHTSGPANQPIHNLGFLPSTASHPDRTFFYDTNDWIIRDIPPNLKYLDFDALKCNFDIVALALWPAKCREVFDKKLHPSWQWQARFLDCFGNTEGGAIPSSIEAAAPYTPVNVTYFDKNLNASVNNLQALADRVDELDIGPSLHAGTVIDPPDDADEFGVVDVSLATPSLKRFTWANLKSRLATLFDSAYLKLSGGTMTGDFSMGSNHTFYTGSTGALADDTCYVITLGPRYYGYVLVTYNAGTEARIDLLAIFSVSGIGARMTVVYAGSLFSTGTGPLTDGNTDGVDGNFNLNAHTDHKLYFKNRMGAARGVSYTLIG
jgi:hypothetical protein